MHQYIVALLILGQFSVSIETLPRRRFNVSAEPLPSSIAEFRGENRGNFEGNLAGKSMPEASNRAVTTRGNLPKELPSVDMWTARWCGPCKVAKPILDHASKNRLLPFKVRQIDVDENPGLWKGDIPIFVWDVPVSRKYPKGRAVSVGWYGLDTLLRDYKNSFQ